MKVLLPLFLVASLFSSENEVGLLMFGASHHFQNRDRYDFQEVNPGLGVDYWHRVEPGSPVQVGTVGAAYLNSYSKMSTVLAASMRYTLGDPHGVHAGAQAGIGGVTGYKGEWLHVVGAVFTGYDRLTLNATFMPYKEPMNDKGEVGSSAVAFWIRWRAAEF